MARTKNGVLVSNDGTFMCTPDHALEVAHMLSTAEGAVLNAGDQYGVACELADVLRDYLLGEEDAPSAIARIRDEFGPPPPAPSQAEEV